jgi:hypothetical protein
MSSDHLPGVNSSSGDAVRPEFVVFISYRRDTEAPTAWRLYEALKARLPDGTVFFDQVSLVERIGEQWLKVIEEQLGLPGAMLVLIGKEWAHVLRHRSNVDAVHGEMDFVRHEVETALQSRNMHVVPVQIDRAPMPKAHELPGSLRFLPAQQSVQLEQRSFGDDVDRIVDRVKQLVADASPHSPGPREALPSPSPTQKENAPPTQHYDDVARHLAEGNLVLFVGPGANAAEANDDGLTHRRPPDARTLARELASLLAPQPGVRLEESDLAQVAQYFDLVRRRGELNRTLTTLTSGCAPTDVHTFLARLPSRLQELGVRQRHQLILTTNYDDTLERAFEESQCEYDLIVYMSSGPNRGRFLHLSHDREAIKPITDSIDYLDLPITDGKELTRSIIVKISGAVDRRGKQSWENNYVVTEDDFIAYLNETPIQELLPSLVLGKLRNSCRLFLGYPLRDWNLRVLLRRLWGAETLEEWPSWSVDAEVDAIEDAGWKKLDVEAFSSPLVPYLAELDRRLQAAAQSLVMS